MKSSWIFLVLVFAAGCATSFTPWRGGQVIQGRGGSVRTVKGVDIWENGEPDRPYVIVGVIDSATLPTSSILLGATLAAGSESDMVNAAKKNGGDAVILVSEQFTSGGYNAMVTPNYSGGGTVTIRERVGKVSKVLVVRYVAPTHEVYHRFFVLALCSDCAGKEVERQIAAGLSSDQVPATCAAEFSDTDHPDQDPDQTNLDSFCRWLYSKGIDGLILITEAGGHNRKSKIGLTLVDTAKNSPVKIYTADDTLHDVSSVSGIGRLLGQWLRQDGYVADVESTQPATVPPSVAPTIVYGSTPQAAPPQPSAFDQAYQAGMIAIASKDFKAALESFHNAVMLDKSSVLAWTGLGFAHGRSHEFSDAMYCYQVALNLNPTNAAALAGQAEVYGQIGETNKYVETLEKVRQISPVVAAAVAEFVKEQNAKK
jgi:hypothetical protein